MVFEQKQAVRQQMKALRAQVGVIERQRAANQVVKHLPELLDLGKGASLGLYHPFEDEFDTRPLANTLWQKGLELSLPVVVGAQEPLLFRPWISNEPLLSGAFNTRAPGDKGLSVLPDMLLIPLLAFDDRGVRLGYGGGFYDRTLADLRLGKGVLAIGLAYGFQRVERLPAEPHDQRLDYILTPAGLSAF